jgi:hypothetical protein
MIRINLLAADRPAAGKKRASAAPSGGGGGAPGALQAYLFLVLFAGGTAVFCGFLWFVKSASIRELDSQIEQAKKRQLELQAIKAKVDEYEAQKRTLDAKINLIEKLQQEQSGPVHLLDEVSRALPEFVWLTNMDQTGATVSFKGESNGLSSVADFMTKLGQAGAAVCSEPTPADRPADRSLCYFNNVELKSSVQQPNNVVQFEVSAQFQNVYPRMKTAGAPGAPAGAPPATQPAAPAAPPKKRP